MSFLHHTIVGRFDPTTLFPNRPLQPSRPLSRQAVETLLAEYLPEVRECVEFRDGFVAVHWAPCPAKLSATVHRFAYHLAEQEGCVAAESPLYYIAYPEAAQRAQNEAAEALRAAKRSAPSQGSP